MIQILEINSKKLKGENYSISDFQRIKKVICLHPKKEIKFQILYKYI